MREDVALELGRLELLGVCLRLFGDPDVVGLDLRDRPLDPGQLLSPLALLGTAVRALWHRLDLPAT
ncbi:hypothetical protein [Phytohabitans flavus]